MRKMTDQIGMAEPEPAHSPTNAIPEDEQTWVSYLDANGQKRFVVTSGAYREKYFLYEVKENGSVKKLGEDASPVYLEDRFHVLDEIKKSNRQ